MKNPAALRYQRAWCYHKQLLLKAYRYECHQMQVYYQTWRTLLWYAQPSHPVEARVYAHEQMEALLTALATSRTRAQALWHHLEALPPLKPPSLL